MSFEVRKLMVSYFTEGSDAVSGDNDFAKLPQHMVLAPWFWGELEHATEALQAVATSYTEPLLARTGVTLPKGRDLWEMSVFGYQELGLDRLNAKIVNALGVYAISLEDSDNIFKPVIFKDIDQPRLRSHTDLEIDHLALVEDHQTGTFSIPEVILLGQD